MILNGALYSNTLEMETGISILIPNHLLNSTKYKVVYLLHGMCGRNSDWINYSMLPVYAEKYNILFVMPEVARSFYTNMVYGQRYYSYIADELPVIIKNVFNISSERKDTGIIGASMGGYGALKCALSKSGNYKYCAAFSSPCLFLKKGLDFQRKNGKTKELIDMYGYQLLNDFEAIFGHELEWKIEDEIIELAKMIKEKEQKPEIYVACGSNDFLIEDNRRFKDEMKKIDYNLIYMEWDGEHNWKFFNEALEKSLELFVK